jgi:hypothetical protein
MACREKNVFDRTDETEVTLRVIIGPTVVDSATDADRELLAGIAGLDGIELRALSTKADVLRDYSEAGFTTCFVEEQDGHYALIEPKRIAGLISVALAHAWYTRPGLPQDAWLEHLIVGHDSGTDLVVGSQAAVAGLPHHGGHNHYCDLQEGVRRIRLFLLATHRTQSGPRSFLNESLYFSYRMRVLFPELAKAHVRIRTVPAVASTGDVDSQMMSLMRRLKFLIEACERGAIEALKSPNNDTEGRALYHIGYECILATAALENIAWVLCHHCALGIHRTEVTLRARGAKESKLSQELRERLPPVFAVVSDPPVVAFLAALFEIRDEIQHREMPHSVGRIGKGLERLPGHLVLPSSAPPAIAAYTCLPIRSEPWVLEEGRVLVDPYDLALAILYGTARLINALLGAIPWSTAFLALPPNEQVAARADHAAWDVGVAQRLEIARSSPLLDMA